MDGLIAQWKILVLGNDDNISAQERPKVFGQGYTRKKEGDINIYINGDSELQYTDDEDEFFLVKKSLVLEC